MPFVDTAQLEVIERRPGWHGRYFQSSSMTFAHYEFERGSSVHEHSHAQEEVWEILEGEVEFTVGGVARIARPGMAAIVGPNVPHAVRAITDGKAIVVDYPRRADP
jgi:quercetin dioxygenase-like cupin family protein